MIDLKYLCDYTINIPIFSENPDDIAICKYLIKKYKNIIIYCHSRDEGKKINNILNSIQNGISDYVDCFTKQRERNIILKKYKDGKISFLVNVKILVEGFDSPLTKGVCFIHMPSSKTTLIQIIGRCLRLHKHKMISNVIIPYSKNDENESICNFLKIISKNDYKIKNSYMNKKIGGYINIEKIIEKKCEIKTNDIVFKYDNIYNSLGHYLSSEDVWNKNYEMVIKFLNETKKRPSTHSENKKIKSLGYWISTQQYLFSLKKGIFISKKYLDIWTFLTLESEHKILFKSSFEIWKNKLEELKEANLIFKSKTYILKWAIVQYKMFEKNKIANEQKIILWTDFIKNNTKFIDIVKKNIHIVDKPIKNEYIILGTFSF